VTAPGAHMIMPIIGGAPLPFLALADHLSVWLARGGRGAAVDGTMRVILSVRIAPVGEKPGRTPYPATRDRHQRRTRARVARCVARRSSDEHPSRPPGSLPHGVMADPSRSTLGHRTLRLMAPDSYSFTSKTMPSLPGQASRPGQTKAQRHAFSAARKL
jgi:hypothetical protein